MSSVTKLNVTPLTIYKRGRRVEVIWMNLHWGLFAFCRPSLVLTRDDDGIQHSALLKYASCKYRMNTKRSYKYSSTVPPLL